MSDKRRDDYKPLKFYADRAAKTDRGFTKFSEGGLEYFAYYLDGKIILISQGYKAVAGRDNGIASTTTNMAKAEQYAFHTHANGKHYFDVMARNKQAVATSVWFASAKAAREHAEVLMGKRKSVTKAKPKTESKAATKTKAAAAVATAASAANVEQDYKPLAFYEARIQGLDTGFDTFVEGDQHYFTYNRDGAPVLLSEGYPTVKARDTGIASVKRNMVDGDQYRYRALKNGQHDFRILAKNNKEVARSIWYGSAAAATAGAAALFAPKADPNAAPIAAPVASPPAAATAAPVAAAAAVGAAGLAAAVPPPTAPPAATAEPVIPVHETGGGLRWLWWLLPLLGLLLLGLCTYRSCAPTDVAAPTAVIDEEPEPVAEPDLEPEPEPEPVPEPVTQPEPTPEELEAQRLEAERVTAERLEAQRAEDARLEAARRERERVAAAERANATRFTDTRDIDPVMVSGPACACAASVEPIFNSTPGALAVSVNRLGTNPEFGNAQGLSPREFYARLQDRYGSNAYDRSYLDYLARSLGYSAFGEVQPSDFGQTELAQSTTGMLGFGQQHAYQYSQLNVSDAADLSAFTLRAPNGCDVAFMKTCGNFMYVCE